MPGRTYKNYLSIRKKECFLLEMDTKRDTPAIRTISQGLGNSQGRSFAFPNFPNFIYPNDILNIGGQEGGNPPFSQLAFISYLFSLRLPSETLEIRRAYADGPMAEFLPQAGKALMGVVKYKGHQMIVLKFAFRGNIMGGFVLFRPCLCSEQDSRVPTLCPAHAIWPMIRGRAPVGERIFAKFPPYFGTRSTKIVMTRIGHLEGPKFSSRSFRRGAAQEINDIGATISLIIQSGTSTHSGYRAYLDLQAGYAVNSSSFVLGAIGSDSDDSDDGQPKKK